MVFYRVNVTKDCIYNGKEVKVGNLIDIVDTEFLILKKEGKIGTIIQKFEKVKNIMDDKTEMKKQKKFKVAKLKDG